MSELQWVYGVEVAICGVSPVHIPASIAQRIDHYRGRLAVLRRLDMQRNDCEVREAMRRVEDRLRILTGPAKPVGE